MPTLTHYPAFALSITVFPGHIQGLHVFEPRYRKLLKELRDGTVTRFVIPFARSNRWEVYGCEVKLKEVVMDYPNGESDILVEGVSVVKLKQAYLSNDKADYHRVSISRKKFKDLTADKFYLKEFQETMQPLLNEDEDITQGFNGNIFDLATKLRLNEPEKHKFISLKNNTERKRFLLNLIRIRISLAAQMKGKDDGIIFN
ncbi:MAG: LON peptidase substrate-binding domain-containing protein [Flavobacteriales bacterium]